MMRKKMYLVGLVLLTILGTLACDTGERKKKKYRFDYLDGGKIPLTPECSAPADECWKDCFRREASRVCGGCCHEQQYLCDLKREHSFDYCKSAQ